LQIRNMTKNVIELDSAMTELKKVTDETDNAYTKFLDNAETRAKRLGATLTDVVTATANAAKMGYSLDDAEKLANIFIMYKEVGDNVTDIDEASNSIVSAMKAFNVAPTNAMNIADVYNEISNTFAVTSGDIGRAVADVGAAFSAAGNSFSDTVAVFTGTNEIIQDWSKSSTAMRTIAARLRNTSGALEEMGIDSDGAAQSITQLQQKIYKLSGVDVMETADSFKSTTQTLRELSKTWDILTDKQRADITALVAGKTARYVQKCA